MKKCEKFLEILVEHDRINPQDLFPPPIESQFALDCLTEALFLDQITILHYPDHLNRVMQLY